MSNGNRIRIGCASQFTHEGEKGHIDFGGLEFIAGESIGAYGDVWLDNTDGKAYPSEGYCVAETPVSEKQTFRDIIQKAIQKAPDPHLAVFALLMPFADALDKEIPAIQKAAIKDVVFEDICKTAVDKAVKEKQDAEDRAVGVEFPAPGSFDDPPTLEEKPKLPDFYAKSIDSILSQLKGIIEGRVRKGGHNDPPAGPKPGLQPCGKPKTLRVVLEDAEPGELHNEYYVSGVTIEDLRKP